MNVTEWVGENLEYARDLVSTALEGAKDGHSAIPAEDRLPKVLVKTAPSSLGLTVLGAGIGVLCGYLGNKRKLTAESALFGVLGGVTGLLIGVGWSTRHETRGMASGAMKNLGTARDAHWLERHPIDYA
ncbi:hypothetical protein Acid345_3366 [Candidatus Koribacter versatilis Ellin345]|uniref:Uncharacterized protein n=1 Tax=Koribacter versatilis (strain Ellin345) TaxID=204669 RepID=Q1IL83_KORVE|nr:hypothetical protein [Candidatus Koribacter versatilis]ABF42367.1 hypothetical protein Acid345_3366 [Candidatus Koribacter versatilis Ellin345]